MNKKRYQKTFVITCLLTLLPILVGLLLYNKLPARMAIHFGLNDSPNGFAAKIWAICAIPILMLLLQLLVFYLIAHESKSGSLNFKIVNITLWFIPIIVNVTSYSIYAFALGYPLKMSFVFNILFGLILVIFGNYLPKTRPNGQIGFRLPWTLNNNVNWQKTHRLAGWLMLLSGLFLLVTALKQTMSLFIIIILIDLIVPIIYSYYLSKK